MTKQEFIRVAQAEYARLLEKQCKLTRLDVKIYLSRYSSGCDSRIARSCKLIELELAETSQKLANVEKFLNWN